ncbi:hypothetical protein [Nitrosomonas supralitoralis]|uniref:Uncharacterized protein n=1 Tax=Nitrosomonas supralitoralis TaxID=2116706 RepID=A0A2P7NR44_9PROT|nr:hypothetical protein [Nitrosomonas supralitoralis]PSJ15956.1 hypothetical protein C7H79_16170 [Nitrosomonas supralitoralis]
MKNLLTKYYSWLSHCLVYLIFFATLQSNQTLAQDVIKQTEFLQSDRPEAWAMSYVTSITLFSGLSVPHSRVPGSVEGGIELGWVPQLNSEQRQIGFNGTKEEDLNKAPIFGRPRVTIGLPWKFALTLSYVPPITIFGIKPNLFAFALERPLLERDFWTVGVRMYGQIGNVEGAFTCPSDVAKFPPGSSENLYGCEQKSADKSSQRFAGLEFSGAYRIEQLRGLTPYIAVSGNFLDTEVQVNAQTFGIRDQTRLVAETWTFAASAGFAFPLTDKLKFSVGVFYSPLWVTRPPATSSQNDGLFNVRSLLTYQFN